jgi:hypothetical protein
MIKENQKGAPKLVYEMVSPFSTYRGEKPVLDLGLNLSIPLALGKTLDGHLDESTVVTQLGQQAMNDINGPNIFEHKLDESLLYVARVFSPFNISRSH